ncbi:hypothetical protein HYS96_00465 [Candidatus Daviesbacteria bacterium]|nr:hypothetical protein [Candidatus Daviesbacteria bacterium]
MLVQSQKGIVHLGLLILLLLGLVAGVYLVQHPQIFKPKAGGGKVWLIDDKGNQLSPKDGGVYEVPSQEIRIYINQPTVWSPSQPQGRLPNLVTAAYAQQSGQCGSSWNNQPTKCADSSGKASDGTQCSGSYLGSYTGCSGNTLYCYSCPGTAAPGGASSAPAGTTCVTNSFSGQTTKCSDSSGKASDGTQCSTYLGTYTGCSGNTPYCYTGCQAATGGSGATSGQTGGQTGAFDASTPKITGSATWGANNIIGIQGQDFGSGGTVYYSPGGQQTAFPTDQVNWSSSVIKVNSDRIPGCTAVKTVDCLIKGGYVKVCRTDNKCSDFARIPDRTIESGSTVRIPTAPKGEAQPEVVEATQEIRISAVRDFVLKGGACEGSEDPAKHCMSLTGDNPDSRYTFAALLTKGYAGWRLANTTEDQNVYVGFISNKGTNFVESIKVRIVRPQPTAQPTPARQEGPARSPQPSPRSPLDSLAGSSNVRCISGSAWEYDSSGNNGVDTGYTCRCKENERNVMVVTIDDPETGRELAETNSPCRTGVGSASPAPSGPAGGLLAKQSCPIEGACVNADRKTVGNLTCTGINEGNIYSCSNPDYPTCLTGVRCTSASPTPSPAASVKPSPSASPTPSPAVTPPPGSGGGTGQGSPDIPVDGTIYVKNNTDQQVIVQKVEQLTSDPVWSWWVFQWGAGYTKLNSQPISILPENSVAFQMIGCSSSDIENSKEKEVKVEYEGMNPDPTLGSISRTATGKYQCGRYGIVTIQ